MKTDPSHFYLNGNKAENVECKKIDLLNLSPLEKEDGVFSYRVEGVGKFCIDYDERYSKESTMKFASTIKVDGDNIVDIDNIKVTLK